MHCNFTSYVCASSLLAFPQVMTVFWRDCITCKRRYFFLPFAGKRPHTQFTCITCSLSVKTGNYTCFYAASTSRRIHAMALNKARKLQVKSSAWCRLTYLHFAGEFTRGVIADCLWLQVILCGTAGFLPAIVRVFFLALAVFYACVFGGLLAILVFLLVKAGNLACYWRANLHEFRM